MLYKQQKFHSPKSLIEYFHDFGRERDEQSCTDFAREMEFRGVGKSGLRVIYNSTNSCLHYQQLFRCTL